MREFDSEIGPVQIYSPEETQKLFVPIRDRIFDGSRGSVHVLGKRVFKTDSWTKVIIRGALMHSDRTAAYFRTGYSDEELLEWAKDDPRDELLPLLDLLVEDGIDQLIHMFPGFADQQNDAVVTRPTRAAIRAEYESYGANLPERLIFDTTAKWGFLAAEDLVGILGGERDLMMRYIDRVGGMDFIREKADTFWRNMIDIQEVSTECVSNYYRLAGWDNPPI